MATFMKKISLISQSSSLFRDRSLGVADISGYQARYLLNISSNEGISQDGLARELMVNKSNVARQVSALEVAGYVKRVQSAEDKRVMLLYTTDKGKALIPQIRESNTRWRAVLCNKLSEKEQEELSRMLQIMVENAREYLYKNDEKN